MAIYPGAQLRLLSMNFSPRGLRHPRGLVVHIAQASTWQSTFTHFNHPPREVPAHGDTPAHPGVPVSAHFDVDRDGTVYQFVDTRDIAYATGPHDPSWISAENVGHTPAPLEEAQLVSLARILRWLNETAHVPVQLAGTYAGSGLGYHSMAGNAGDHSCPGRRVIEQLPRIVEIATRIKRFNDPYPA